MRKYKHIGYNVNCIQSMPAGTEIMYEYMLPRVVMDEEGLAKLAEKKGFNIVTKLQEPALPSVQRVMRMTVPFTNFDDVEEVLRSVHRSFSLVGTVLEPYKCLLLPAGCGHGIFVGTDTFYGLSALIYLTTFERESSNVINFEEIVPSLYRIPPSLIRRASLVLQKDMDVQDNKWKLLLGFPNPKDILMSDNLVGEFCINSEKLLNADRLLRLRLVLP